MRNPGLTKTFVAGATINKYRIVKFDSADGQVIQGAAATDLLIGVADIPGPDGSTTVLATERVDVVLAGVMEVEFAGTVARGAAVTSDTVGRAVAAAPATGVNNRIIGFAAASYVSGDIGGVILAPSSIQG